jgi:hypothetical protein
MPVFGCLPVLLIAAAIISALVVFEYLNFHEFCYSEGRFLGDRALIDAAIRHQIDFMQRTDYARATPEYGSVQEFHQANPICCSLDKWGDGRLSIWRRRLLGQELMIVDLWYRFRDAGPV